MSASPLDDPITPAARGGYNVARRRAPVLWPVLQKEIRLQRNNLLFLLVVFLFWLGLRILCVWAERQVAGYRVVDLVSGLQLIGVQSCLAVFLPLMFGATAVAGERQLGVLDWQLAAPRARAVQLFIKLCVVLGLAAFTGGVVSPLLDYLLPAADYLAMIMRGMWPGAYAMVCAAVALRCSVQARDSTRALVGAFPLLIAAGVVAYLADPALVLLPPMGFVQGRAWVEYARLAVATAVLLWLAGRSFRPQPPRWVSTSRFDAAWLLVVFILNVAAVHMIRHVDVRPASTVVHSLDSGMYRLHLLAGRESDWESAMKMRGGTVLHPNPGRSPGGRLAGAATNLDLKALLLRSVVFDVDVASGRTRTFPGAVGQLHEIRPNGSYEIGYGENRFLAGSVPMLTFPIQSVKEESALVTDFYPQRPINRDDQRILRVQEHGPENRARDYLFDLPAGVVSGEKNLIEAGFRFPEEPRQFLATHSANLATTTARVLQATLFRLDEQTRRAELLDMVPMHGNPTRHAMDTKGRWVARPQREQASVWSDVDVLGLTPDGHLSGTTWTLPAEGKRVMVGNTFDYLLRQDGQSLLSLLHVPLNLSPDGSHLAALRYADNETRYEVLLLDLRNGEVKNLGAWETGLAMKLLGSERKRFLSSKGPLDEERGKLLSQWQHHPLLAWSPGGALAVLDGETLYLYEDAARWAAGARQPRKLDVSRAVASNLVFWDEETLLLSGQRSIWKLTGKF